MTNTEFLEAVRESFKTYLNVGTSRSPAKLNSLHGSIANDLSKIFGNGFEIKSKGYGNDKEGIIDGRYYPKNVDITVSKNGVPVAGYAVKFVMRNYSQNSNNYFENMLGETANIRSNNIPYFQIFIIFDKVPYYKSKGIFDRYDIVTPHNLEKYLALSKDNPAEYYHTPDKTLVVLIKLKEKSPFYKYRDENDYADYYQSVINDVDLFQYASQLGDPFSDGVIFNDYNDFIKRTYYTIMGRLKN